MKWTSIPLFKEGLTSLAFSFAFFKQNDFWMMVTLGVQFFVLGVDVVLQLWEIILASTTVSYGCSVPAQSKALIIARTNK